jgi:hypothetical protein
METHEAACPADGCTGVIWIRDSLPSGEYPCLCYAKQLRLTWATKTNSEQRYPVLSVAGGR